jgi:hypothetical protein
MHDSNRTDPDNSARHIYSAAIDVFNRTVIMTSTILFNRSSRLANQSSMVCSVSLSFLSSRLAGGQLDYYNIHIHDV